MFGGVADSAQPVKPSALHHFVPAGYGQGKQKGPKSVNFPWLFRPESVAKNP